MNMLQRGMAHLNKIAREHLSERVVYRRAGQVLAESLPVVFEIDDPTVHEDSGPNVEVLNTSFTVARVDFLTTTGEPINPQRQDKIIRVLPSGVRITYVAAPGTLGVARAGVIAHPADGCDSRLRIYLNEMKRENDVPTH